MRQWTSDRDGTKATFFAIQVLKVTMSEITKRQQAIIKEFSNLATWEDRYKKIIAIGKALTPIDPKYQTSENKVKGCQSQVWMFADLNDKGQMQIYADSDAMIVRGLVALLVRVYSLALPQDILQSPPVFIKELGFANNLSPSRANGLQAMVKQIMFYAMAYSNK